MTVPKPGQAFVLYVSAIDWGTCDRSVSVPWSFVEPLPPLGPPDPPFPRVTDGLELLRRSTPDDYEFRPMAYMHLRCRTPMRLDIGPEWNEIRRKIRHWDSYAIDTDCEAPDWDDRANREDCYRDWWRADWVKAAWAAFGG